MEVNLKDNKMLDDFLELVKDREQWLTVIKFGLPTLLDDQLFLVELIIKRAKKESAANNNKNIVGYFTGIFDDLGLKLEKE